MHSSYYKWNMAIICNPPIMLCATFVPCLSNNLARVHLCTVWVTLGIRLRTTYIYHCQYLICMNWTVNLIAVLVKMPETNGSKSKPEGRGHTAEVWKYFTLSDDKTKTSCNLCRMSLAYSGGGTSSMRNHLNRVHKKNVRGIHIWHVLYPCAMYSVLV